MKTFQPVYRIATIIVLLLSMLACTGIQTFTTAARPGETIALALGWRHHLTRDNLIDITITDASANTFIYSPTDTSIRAIYNTYPDPISNLVVGYETNQNIVGNEQTWGGLIQSNVTNFDRDWSQKILLIDLPAGIFPGSANISVTIALEGGGTETIPSQSIEILDVAPAPFGNLFQNYESLSMSSATLKSFERANHYKVLFSGTTLPHAIQVDLTHDPDVDNGGAGRAYVANPRGDIKNVHWADDGINTRVIVIPSHGQSLAEWSDFKFYVAGEITGLTIVPGSAQGFDINGNPIAVTSQVK